MAVTKTRPSATPVDADRAGGGDCGRPNWAEVDPSAIADNVRALRRYIGPKTKLFSVLKANGFGFGLLRAAAAVEAAGTDAISLVDPGEAVRIRRHGVRVPILVYGGGFVTRELVEAAIRHDLTVTVHNPETADAYARFAGAPLTVFVEVNAGSERLGVHPDEVVPLVRRLREHPHLRVGGVYTHPAVPGGEGAAAFVDWEFGRFVRVLDRLAEAGIEVPVRMAASSKMLRMGRHMNLNAVDPGTLVFGLDPGGPGAMDTGVRSALIALKSRLVQAHRPEPTEFPAHAPFSIRAGMRIGVFPMGASDRLGELHAGEVLVRGRRSGFLGKLSAEHARIDLTGIPEAAVGDEVVIIGAQGDDAITVADVMRRTGVSAPTVTEAIPPALLRIETDAGRRPSAVRSGGPGRRRVAGARR